MFPLVCGEQRRWRALARGIEDPQLRVDALVALAKPGNLEGAAAFASFAPAAHRSATVRASVAFQAAYDYLDVLSERPHVDPISNSLALNAALVDALTPMSAPAPATPLRDYYALHAHRRDSGYLGAMLACCRQALAQLPSYAAAAPAAQRAAERSARFQGLNFAEGDREPSELASWAARIVPARSGLAWWESAAAAGSSLAVHALIAAAARPALDASEVVAIEDAYFPWISALHSLLDQLVDVEEDARAGHNNVVACYRDADEIARALAWIARTARRKARTLATARHGAGDSLILAAMAASYLSLPQARRADVRPARDAVLAELAPSCRAAIFVFRTRRFAQRG